MEFATFFPRFLATDAPHLPDAAIMRWSLHVCWAMVLGASTLGLSSRLASAWRWGLTLTVMFWTMLPGSISPSQWLGLAFQSPSLTSTVLSMVYFLTVWHAQPNGNRRGLRPMIALPMLTLAAIVLGWVLLLDTLAWWPISVYAWGFSPSAFACVVVLAIISLAICNDSPTHRTARWSILLVLTLYVVTRLPTGNVWDALIDPWLWLILQVRFLIWLVRNRFNATHR